MIAVNFQITNATGGQIDYVDGSFLPSNFQWLWGPDATIAAGAVGGGHGGMDDHITKVHVKYQTGPNQPARKIGFSYVGGNWVADCDANIAAVV